MHAPPSNRSRVPALLGTLLLSTGIVVALLLAIHLLKGAVDARIAQAATYLVITSTPELTFPPPRPTATPSAPPPPPALLPPVRIEISSIGLNTNIIAVAPEEKVAETGDVRWRWAAAEYAVGHHVGTGYPGGGTNIVFSGHNNSHGRVFQHLPNLNVGDEVIVYTADKAFRYTVHYRTIVKYRGREEEAEWTLQTFAAPTDSERLTLFSCYPYTTNADRIVAIALPSQ